MIDTHCHLDFKDYKDDLDNIIKECIDKNIYKIINPGSSVERSKRAFLNSKKYDIVYFACGSHPEEVCDKDSIELFNKDNNSKLEDPVRLIDDIEQDISNVFTKLVDDKKCVAIGEIGLDYNFITNFLLAKNPTLDIEKIKDLQKELFRFQLDFAQRHNKPVIIHNREAKDDIYSILKEYNLKGVIHCFSEDKDYAEKVLDLGFNISFTGNITFKNVKSYTIDAIKYIPKERILCETDGPFLAPQDFRGQTNYPMYVRYVYDKICEIKGIEFKDFEDQVDKNVKELFGI